MKTSGWIVLIIIIIIAGGAVWYFSADSYGSSPTASTTPPIATSTEQTTITPQGLSFAVPTGFALATGQEPIMVQSYIPPCDQGYDYCIYKDDSEFSGTNFESAGLSVTNRTDLASESACLDTPPTGYSGTNMVPSATSTGAGYTVSVFANLGSAATGHEALDNYYHLYNSGNGSCTEIDERVAQTAYDNYAAGQIQEFTADDKAQVISELDAIRSAMTISGTSINWPTAPAS